MGLISKRSRCFSGDPRTDELVCHHLSRDPQRPLNRQNIKSTPAIQEVDSHAMILSQKHTAAFNVHWAGLGVPPAHVCWLPPESPGTPKPRPLRSTEFISLELSTS